MRLKSASTGLLLGILLGACAPPSPDHVTWSSQAGTAIDDVSSQVATTRLVLSQGLAGRVTGSFQQIVSQESEAAVGRTVESFGAQQPPVGDDATYHVVMTAMGDAEDVLGDARIAIVRREMDAYPTLIRRLSATQQTLSEARGASGMKRLFAVALGILTAIGGLVDIGDLVTNAQVGARFGLSLAWVVVVGVLGICVFAEMSGRVAAVSGRATFDLVRERLGPRLGFLNLAASMLITFLTFTAEIGGVALSLQLVASVHVLLIVPLVGLLVWLLLWKAKFSAIENVLGLLGLALIVFAVAVWQLGPDWTALLHQAAAAQKPHTEHWNTFAYYAVALFGAAMTPYEVFFFSLRGVEEGWGTKDLATMRANVFIGFPLGGVLSLAIAASAWLVLAPEGITVDSLGQVALPVAVALGKVGLAVAIVGFVAATFGAACETGLSVGYSVAQYFGAQWGKYVQPADAAFFHLLVAVSALGGTAFLMTAVDPILVTEVSVVFSAVALPLTYFPILVVANDPDYMGEHTNGRLANALGSVYLLVIGVAALSAIPLMIWTRMGQ